MPEMIIKRVMLDTWGHTVSIKYRVDEDVWVDDPAKARDYSHQTLTAETLVNMRNKTFHARSYSLEPRSAEIEAYAGRVKAATQVHA